MIITYKISGYVVLKNVIFNPYILRYTQKIYKRGKIGCEGKNSACTRGGLVPAQDNECVGQGTRHTRLCRSGLGF